MRDSAPASKFPASNGDGKSHPVLTSTHRLSNPVLMYVFGPHGISEVGQAGDVILASQTEGPRTIGFRSRELSPSLPSLSAIVSLSPVLERF